MNIKKLSIPACALAISLTAVSIHSNAQEMAPAGTEIGHLYATDIVTLWDGAVIPSYNIGKSLV